MSTPAAVRYAWSTYPRWALQMARNPRSWGHVAYWLWQAVVITWKACRTLGILTPWGFTLWLLRRRRAHAAIRRHDTCSTCHHPAHAHEHHRRGSDCGACTCPRLRR